MKFANKRTLCLLAAMLIGLACLAGGLRLLITMTGQVGYYNLGLKAYTSGDMPHAVQFFDKSLAAYRAQQHARWLERFIYPQPSDELAAQADFQKAKALLQMQKAEQAVDAFKESLKLNPGNRCGNIEDDVVFTKTGPVYVNPASGCANLRDAQRLHEEAMVVKYDLEMLFKSRPDLAQQQGKGQGQGQGNKQGQPQQDPGQNPANQAGKGNRDDI